MAAVSGGTKKKSVIDPYQPFKDKYATSHPKPADFTKEERRDEGFCPQ